MAKDIRVTEDNVLSEVEFVLKQMGLCRRAQALFLLNRLPIPIDMSYTDFLNAIANIINSLGKQ